jgi:hypothetical protein
MEYVAKILMNALYGKFGQKFYDKDNWMPCELTLEEMKKYDLIERFGDYLRVKNEIDEPSAFCIPIWAAYVTAYGRLKLAAMIDKYDPVYVDTDSLITEHEIPTSNALGELKLEMTVKEGVIVRPKFYGLVSGDGKDYVKIKGIAIRFNFMRFKEFVENPSVKYDKFMRFKESIRRGFIPNEIREIQKELSCEDTKRRWRSAFDMNVLQDSEALDVSEVDKDDKCEKKIQVLRMLNMQRKISGKLQHKGVYVHKMRNPSSNTRDETIPLLKII